MVGLRARRAEGWDSTAEVVAKPEEESIRTVRGANQRDRASLGHHFPPTTAFYMIKQVLKSQ